MRRLGLVLAASLALAAGATADGDARTAREEDRRNGEHKKPNIVLIVVDGLGHADLGFRNGGEIDTPHLDAIAKRGVELERYYVHAMCSPSRAALMTGRYAHHTGVHDTLEASSNLAVEPDEVFLSDKLKQAGYATHMVGKWHLGHHRWKYLPTYRGFDSYYGFLTGTGSYYMHRSMGNRKSYRYWFHYLDISAPKCNVESCVRIPWEAQTQYSTELLTEKAIRVVERHAEAFDGKPLFLYVAYQGVGAGSPQPTQVPLRFVTPYESRIASPTRRQFAAMLSAVDEGVGNLTQALLRNGLSDDNTIIVVSTDSGGTVGTEDAIGSSNAPFRGGRYSLLEGGVRGTAFLAGSGIDPAASGSTYGGLMHIADWFATLADAAGFSLDTDKPLDSVSHWTALSSKPDQRQAAGHAAGRSEVVLGNVSAAYGTGFAMIVDGSDVGEGERSSLSSRKLWKIVAGSAGAGQACPEGFCLYELTSDPRESHDLAADPAYKDILSELRKRLLVELDSSQDLAADCSTAPFDKYEQHVNHAWYPFCD